MFSDQVFQILSHSNVMLSSPAWLQTHTTFTFYGELAASLDQSHIWSKMPFGILICRLSFFIPDVIFMCKRAIFSRRPSDSFSICSNSWISPSWVTICSFCLSTFQNAIQVNVLLLIHNTYSHEMRRGKLFKHFFLQQSLRSATYL